MNENKLIRALYKKAVGFKIKEVSEEFSEDGEGGFVLARKKIVAKELAPDLSALKVLIETDLGSKDYASLSDDDLKNEAKRLLLLLEGDGTPTEQED